MTTWPAPCCAVLINKSPARAIWASKSAKQKPRQLQPALVDHVPAGGRSPVATRQGAPGPAVTRSRRHGTEPVKCSHRTRSNAIGRATPVSERTHTCGPAPAWRLRSRDGEPDDSSSRPDTTSPSDRPTDRLPCPTHRHVTQPRCRFSAIFSLPKRLTWALPGISQQFVGGFSSVCHFLDDLEVLAGARSGRCCCEGVGGSEITLRVPTSCSLNPYRGYGLLSFGT
jgi:hypothetical protein